MTNVNQKSDYFVYCTQCKKRVINPEEPCLNCKTAEFMVDWPEPIDDCLQFINGEDCLDRGGFTLCIPCQDWLKWENAKYK